MLAKGKLNTIGSLVSKSLINIDISHKEFITILREKDKYEKIKENVRNMSEKLEEKQENMRLNSVNKKKTSLQTRNLLKIIEYLHHYYDFYEYCDDPC